MGKERLSEFFLGMQVVPVRFVETQQVKEGVECDIYVFEDDDSKDLAIIRVAKGCKTPLQRVLLGDKTIEGFLNGYELLKVTSRSREEKIYEFKPGDSRKEVVVGVGETMQWHAIGNSDLTFYEICEPAYEDGRFENIPE